MQDHVWIVGDRRLMLGLEKLASQGIMLPRRLHDCVTEAEKATLAGNAFCVAAYLVAFCSMMYAYGRVFGPNGLRAPQMPAQLSDSESDASYGGMDLPELPGPVVQPRLG